jgi:ADP-ribose pyrophosphatase
VDRELRERLISSHTEFEGRLISLHVDEVELADGTVTTREVVHHPGAVAIAPLLPEGRIVMIRQYRHAARQVLWELPAGIIEPGESPEDCARRELAEETGYAAGEMRRILSTHLSPGCSTEIIHIFVARGLEPISAAGDADERIEPIVLPLSEAVAMVREGKPLSASAICGLLAAALWAGDAPRGGHGPGRES